MGYSIKGTVKCNMGCKYCYESEARSENRSVGEQEGYDVDKIIQFLESRGNSIKDAPALHGGEPLLLPKEQNEKIMAFIFKKWDKVHIQTNATLIDEDYIRMFKQYNVQVGVSIDGNGELNLGRSMGTDERTLKTTEKIIENIKWMRREGIHVSTICVISKKNGTPDKIPQLKEWLLELKNIGVTGGRLNMIQIDFPELTEEFELTNEEATNFYREMYAFTRSHRLNYTPFTDVIDGLLGYGHKTCVTAGCDPWHTTGEMPIYGDGTQGNCLRTAKDGVVYLAEFTDGNKPRVSNERSIILRQIPMNEGGCGGCRFWNICNAHCPTNGVDGDWRNKTRYCEVLYDMFSMVENSIKQLMPRTSLVTDLTAKIGDQEVNKLMRQEKLNDLVFEDMNKKRGAF